MDRGRMIDNIQNTNARFIDNYGSNHRTSIKMINPPGGRSSFSLGWGFEEPKKNSTPLMSRNNNMLNNNTQGNNSQLNNTGYGMNQNYQQYNNVYNNDRSTYGQRVMATTNYHVNNQNFQQTVPNQFNNGNNYQINNGNMSNNISNYNNQPTYQQYENPPYNQNPMNNVPIVSNHIQPSYDNSNSRFKYNNRNQNTKDDIFPQSTSNQSPQDYSRSNPYCNNYSDFNSKPSINRRMNNQNNDPYSNYINQMINKPNDQINNVNNTQPMNTNNQDSGFANYFNRRRTNTNFNPSNNNTTNY